MAGEMQQLYCCSNTVIYALLPVGAIPALTHTLVLDTETLGEGAKSLKQSWRKATGTGEGRESPGTKGSTGSGYLTPPRGELRTLGGLGSKFGNVLTWVPSWGWGLEKLWSRVQDSGMFCPKLQLWG